MIGGPVRVQYSLQLCVSSYVYDAHDSTSRNITVSPYLVYYRVSQRTIVVLISIYLHTTCSRTISHKDHCCHLGAMAWHAAQADVRAWAAMLAVKDEAWDEAHWPGLCSSYGTVPSYQIHYASPDLDSLYDMP